MIRRVCFYAGPGAGKSTVAEGVSYFLKKKGHNVDLTREYIKDWAYMKRVPQSFEQAYIFANQMHLEDFLLSRGVQTVVSDSPVMMNLAYSKRYGFKAWEELMVLAKRFDAAYQPLNIFLSRDGIPYHENGRYETALQARWMDQFILDFMEDNDIKYTVMRSVEIDKIVEFVEREISGNQDSGRCEAGEDSTSGIEAEG